MILLKNKKKWRRRTASTRNVTNLNSTSAVPLSSQCIVPKTDDTTHFPFYGEQMKGVAKGETRQTGTDKLDK